VNQFAAWLEEARLECIELLHEKAGAEPPDSGTAKAALKPPKAVLKSGLAPAAC